MLSLLHHWMGTPFPPLIACTLLSMQGLELQTNIIDLLGTQGLSLGDSFGAVTVETCNGLSCVEELSYTVDILNTGGSTVDISVFHLSFNDTADNVTAS